MFEKFTETYHCQDILNGELDKIIPYLEKFPYYIETKDWIIVHAELGLDKHYRQNDARFLFGQSNFESLYRKNTLKDKMQVFGHTARDIDDIIFDSFMTSPVINIDGGCVYPEYGYLCGLDLDEILVTHVQKK